MGEIRIVGPGKRHGYPYPVCKKAVSAHFSILPIFSIHLKIYSLVGTIKMI